MMHYYVNVKYFCSKKKFQRFAIQNEHNIIVVINAFNIKIVIIRIYRIIHVNKLRTMFNYR